VSGGEENFAFNSVLAQSIFGGASFIAPLFLVYLVRSLGQNQDENILNFVFSKLVSANLLWTSLYWIFALITLIMVVIISISHFPAVERKEDEKAGTWEVYKNLFKQKTVILYFIGIFTYVGTEQGVSYWLSKFLYTYHNYDPLTVGASIVGWFWGMLSIGCLIGLGLLKLFDSRKILLGAVILTVIFLSTALFGPGSAALIAFPMVGFSLSVMWSIVFSLALNSIDNHHGSFAGILCTAIIGGATIQIIIGWIGDMFGLRIGMFIIYLALGYIFSIGIWAKPIITNKTISLKKKTKEVNEI
jgi:fucose permease